MKKITLVLSALILFIGTNMAKASAEKVFDDVERRHFTPVDYRYAEPIVFMERGIEFMIFPNGEFDFNTVTTNSGPRPRNTTYGAPRGNAYGYYGPANRGVRVEHDYMGRVRRIGNVYINYDAVGRVKRVGSVYMSYNSFALSQVGGLRIIYDRRGRIIDIRGFVNASNHGYTYMPVNNHYSPTSTYTNNGYSYGNDNGYNDEDFYYYKADGTKVKMSNEDVVEIKKEERELSKIKR